MTLGWGEGLSIIVATAQEEDEGVSESNAKKREVSRWEAEIVFLQSVMQ